MKIASRQARSTRRAGVTRSLSVLALAVAGVFCGSSAVLAAPILGSDLASFAVLGASTVTNTNPATNLPLGPTTITGNVGVWSSGGANAITGLVSTQVVGTIYPGGIPPQDAQTQLMAAITNLAGMTPTSTISGGVLDGLTLVPGVYSVPGTAFNLTGTLILDGGGNANAAWVFQMASTLITASSSVVDVINTGGGAGVYWVLPTTSGSATLGTGSTFEGNILAEISVGLNTGAKIGCGRALAHVGAVTMDTNIIGLPCTGTGEQGSNGLSGGLEVTTLTTGGPGKVAPLPFASVPEPGTLALLALGLAGLGVARRRR